MKTLLIVAAIIVFLVHGFVMYCCIKVSRPKRGILFTWSLTVPVIQRMCI